MNLEAAESRLLDWMAGANALALIGAVQAADGFGALREPLTVEAFAERVSTDRLQAQRILMALEAMQVVTHADNRYVLTDGWATITAADRPAALSDRLGILAPLRRGLEGALSDLSAFDDVDPAEAVALARSVWGVANSPAALESWAALDAAMPEVRAVWQRGAYHAEFGCGAGRDLIRVVAMYPKVRAVGYDILDYVLDHARDLARKVSVEARVAFRCEDILSIAEENAFDTIMWSHMFFAGESRAKALDSVRRALKPGGYLIMPFMADLPAPEAVATAAPALFQLTVAVAYRRWNIYWPTAAELRAEMESEGFTHLHTIPHPRTPFMAMRLDTDAS